jgi:hypothetical protein
VSAPRAIPSSRAYWDLQAEKLMNRIFDPEDPIDLEGSEAGDPAAPADSLDPGAPGLLEQPAHPPKAEPAPRRQRARRPAAAGDLAASLSPLSPAGGAATESADPGSTPSASAAPAGPQPGRPGGARGPAWTVPHQPLLLLAVFAGAGLITAASGVLALSQWNRFQQSLQQERNLLLVERLRSFGPAAQPAAPVTPPAPTLDPPAGGTASSAVPAAGGPASSPDNAATLSATDAAGLPPPPPGEPWIEQLGELPQARPAQPLLRVPLNARLAAPPPAPPPPVRRRTPSGPLPLLVGVVAAPGKAGSAIFQMGGSTSTVGVGDSIGNSGWRLRSTDGDSVQVDHEGELRRITIGSGG